MQSRIAVRLSITNGPRSDIKMAPISGLSHLSNPLATPKQLANSASHFDGVLADLEDSIRYACQRLIQAAGVSIRLPQEIIAQAIVIFTRVWLGPEGGSLLRFDGKVSCLPHSNLIGANTSTRRSQQLQFTWCASLVHIRSVLDKCSQQFSMSQVGRSY